MLLIIGITFTLIILILFTYSFFNPEKFNIKTERNSYGKRSISQVIIFLSVLWLVVISLLISSHFKKINDPHNLEIGRFSKGDMTSYFDEAEGNISLLEDSIFIPEYRDEGIIGAKITYKFDEPSIINDPRGFQVAITTIYQSLLVDCENNTFLPTQFDVYTDDGMHSTHEGYNIDMLGRKDFYSSDSLKGLYKASIRKICSVYEFQYGIL